MRLLLVSLLPISALAASDGGELLEPEAPSAEFVTACNHHGAPPKVEVVSSADQGTLSIIAVDSESIDEVVVDLRVVDEREIRVVPLGRVDARSGRAEIPLPQFAEPVILSAQVAVFVDGVEVERRTHSVSASDSIISGIAIVEQHDEE